MRLESITLEGFRGFVEKMHVDLNADVVVIHGPNGVGKTSLLDAILWGLSGRIDRLGGAGSPVSLYAKEGLARVELRLSDPSSPVTITRMTDGERHQLRLREGEVLYEGHRAEARLLEILLPQLIDRSAPNATMGKILTRGVYLQQDLIRQFIESDTSTERFNLVSEIIGAGAIVELQAELERSRTAWARATNNTRKNELEPAREQLERVNQALSNLAPTDLNTTFDLEVAAEEVFQKARSVLGEAMTLKEPPVRAASLDGLQKELTASRTVAERELSVLRAVLAEMASYNAPELGQLSEQLQAKLNEERQLTSEVERLEAEIGRVIASMEEARQRALLERGRAQHLATMAQIALNHLDGSCPVCTQPFEKEVAVRHLQELISAANTLSDASSSPPQSEVGALNDRLSVRRHLLQAAREQAGQYRRQIQEAEAQSQILFGRLEELNIHSLDGADRIISDRINLYEEKIKALEEVIQNAERLILSFARIREGRQREELEQRKVALEARVFEINEDVDEKDKTHALATEIIDGLRKASLDITAEQVRALEPLFQRIYSRIEPHPTFRITQLATAMERGRGKLLPGIMDPELGEGAFEAIPVLSSSQLNAFAASLFLAINLGVPSMNLNVCVLDDPLQSLDAINLLGLVDVFRRLREHRQILISTHEAQLVGLLQRKLRPVREGERLLLMHFERWSRSGPAFSQSMIGFDEFANAKVFAVA